MSSPSIAYDGDPASRILIGPTKISYPFLNSPTKDTTTKFFERLYEVDRASYTPFAAAASLPSEGTDDPADGSALIIKETEPQPRDDGAYQVRCLFGYTPIDQVTTGLYMALTKPDASKAGSPAWPLLPANSIVYSLDLASVYPAMYQYAGYYFAPGLNTVFGPITAVTSATAGGNTTVNWTSHGLTGTESFVIQNASISAFSYVASGQYTVINANSISITGHTYGTNLTNAGKYFRAYSPYSGIVRTRETVKFYTDGSTIPAPPALINDGPMLTAVLANLTGYVDYSATKAVPWQGTSLLAVTVTAVNFADL